MASPDKQQKRALRAKAKAKQNRTQRAAATKPDAFAGEELIAHLGEAAFDARPVAVGDSVTATWDSTQAHVLE